ARTTLAELERRSSGSRNTADVDALEAAHAEVERARDGIDARFGRARAQRRLDDAVAAEGELLERLGLTSYTEFLTLGGATARPEVGATELEIARRSVEQAQTAAEECERRVDDALLHAELVAARRALLDEARALLRDPALADDRAMSALMEHRVEASASVQIDHLVDLLEAVGLPVRDLDLGDDEIEEMAAEWLADRQHTESRLLRRIDELESVDASNGDDAPDPLALEEPERVEEIDAAGAATALVDEARAAVDAAEDGVRAAKDRVMAHESVTAQIATLDEESSVIAIEIATHDAEREAATEAARDDATDGGAAEETPADDRAADALAEASAAAESAATGVVAARTAVATAQAHVDETQGEYGAAVEELAALRQMVAELDDDPPPVEEVEWYLLARLAGQRQQSFVGSLPLLVIGALDSVDDDEGLHHLLDRLERMAGAVQIVHLTDEPRIIAWAEALPEDRAAVVRPVARVD
ncbi:MAG: hypothetical protein OSA99_20780, partial [Acidimicrobiales bacterium]|nr:hypothetical protein [Acidimicrobiales bacterium]